MRVDESSSTSSGTSQTRRETESGDSFGKIFAAIQNQKASGDSSSAVKPSSTASGATVVAASESASSVSNPEQYFRDYMSQTPEQRMFYSWLAKKHISKEQYAALSSQDQQKLKDEFEDYVRKQAENKLGTDSLESATA